MYQRNNYLIISCIKLKIKILIKSIWYGHCFKRAEKLQNNNQQKDTEKTFDIS